RREGEARVLGGRRVADAGEQVTHGVIHWHVVAAFDSGRPCGGSPALPGRRFGRPCVAGPGSRWGPSVFVPTPKRLPGPSRGFADPRPVGVGQGVRSLQTAKTDCAGAL